MIKDQAEFKVGLFVLLALLSLGLVIYQTGEVYVRQGYKIRVLFGYTGGLEIGAPVQVAGVPVGEVEEITFRDAGTPETRVEVVARIREDVRISKSARVGIGARSLLGKKHLEILPGADGNELQRGEWLVGQDPVMMEEVAETGRRVAKKLEKTVDALNQWIADESFQKNVKDNLSQSSALLADVKEAVRSMNILFNRLNNKEGTLGKLIADDALYEDLKTLVGDLKENPWKLVHKESKKKGFLF